MHLSFLMALKLTRCTMQRVFFLGTLKPEIESQRRE